MAALAARTGLVCVMSYTPLSVPPEIWPLAIFSLTSLSKSFFAIAKSTGFVVLAPVFKVPPRRP
jgi:hypothetical protein